MKHFLLTVLGTLVGIFLFFIVLFFLFAMIGAAAGSGKPAKPKGGYVLSMDLRKPMMDHSPGTSLFGQPSPSVVATVRSLERAKNDDDVNGLFIRASNFGMAPASAEELRMAIKDFKDSGKFVITHAQGFEGTSITGYHAVSASSEIWLQDTTAFAVSGYRSEADFYGGVFEKIDATPQIMQFHEYKNAANTYMQKGLTDAHRESTTSLLTSLYDTGMGQIAEDRGLELDELKQVLGSSPHSAEDAMEAKMVDTLGQFEEAREYARKKAGGDSVKFLDIGNYGTGNNYSGDTIAFIGGQGAVVTGQSASPSPFSNSVSMGSDTVAKAFDDAAKDKKVKAIIFRVSSPGGSPAASDQIHEAVARAQDAGKPVIISMGRYAASGGYYVSANADKIVALPTTITGSIGVLGGKVAFEGSFEKIGYNIEGITVGGDFAGAYSMDEPFNQSQLAAYRGQLEDIYEDFTNRVAEGRDIPIDRVLEIAKGRVWTGEQAKELGLVDELGGISKAITMAKEIAEIDADARINLKVFPRPKTTSEQLEELFGGTAELGDDIALLRQISQLPEVQAAIRARQSSKIGQELSVEIPELTE